MKGEVLYNFLLAIVHTYRKVAITFYTFFDKITVRFRDHEGDLRIGFQQWNQSFAVEMVSMIMTGRNHVNTIQQFRLDYQFAHPDMRFVGGGIFFSEGI